MCFASLSVSGGASIRVSGYSKTPPQETSTVEAFAEAIEEKWRNGSGPKAIWAALREELPGFTGSRWAVARLCRRLHRAQSVRPDDIAIPVITPPGAEAQVDFGYVGELYDPDRGVLRKAWVFAMVLGYSRDMYARIVFDQRVETWLWLHAQAFEHFGGVVASNRPDNLKAAVIRGAFNSGDARRLNRSYRELARHYGFVIDPTPVYSREKKGKVEAAVKYIKRSFIAPRAFDDIDDANARLAEWVMETAGTRRGRIRRPNRRRAHRAPPSTELGVSGGVGCVAFCGSRAIAGSGGLGEFVESDSLTELVGGVVGAVVGAARCRARHRACRAACFRRPRGVV